MGHPKVAEAAVIGVPHPHWDERPLACVVVKEGETLTEEEVLDYLDAAGGQVVDARRRRVHRRGAQDQRRQVLQEGPARAASPTTQQAEALQSGGLDGPAARPAATHGTVPTYGGRPVSLTIGRPPRPTPPCRRRRSPRRVRDKMTIESGSTKATVHKRLVGIRDHYIIEVDGGQDIKAHGNIVDHEYEIERTATPWQRCPRSGSGFESPTVSSWPKARMSHSSWRSRSASMRWLAQDGLAHWPREGSSALTTSTGPAPLATTRHTAVGDDASRSGGTQHRGRAPLEQFASRSRPIDRRQSRKARRSTESVEWFNRCGL